MRTINAVIPAYRISALHRNLRALNKRAATLRADGSFSARVGDARIMKIENADGNNVPVKVFDVEITGPDFSIAGFEVVCFAKIDGNTRLYSDYNADGFDGYADITTTCDHCNKERARLNMYVLRNQETGAFIQVGKTCVKDFLGHSVSDALKGAGFWVEINDELDGFLSSQTSTDESYKLLDVVAVAVKDIAEHGYINRETAEFENRASTSERVKVQLETFAKASDDQIETARAVIEWAKGNFATPEGDFANTVAGLLELEYVTRRMVGFIACLPALKSRAEERARIAEQGAASEHFGSIKQRVEGNFEVVAEHTFEGNYGVTTLYTLIVDGNVAKWFSSNGGLEIGQTGRAKMTVKKHDDYKGTKQTVVNRVTVL